MKGELENRDREELGDLPEDQAILRGELDRYSPAKGAVPADMLGNADKRRAAGNTPLGSPMSDFDVRSTYDSRPVWGRDFNQWFGSGEIAPNPLTFFNCLVVPVGYVMVLRKVQLWASTLLTLSEWPYQVAVTKNLGQVMPEVLTRSGPSEVFPGIMMASQDEFECFVVADEYDTLGIQFLDTDNSPLPDAQVRVGFYGNLLLKTGVPSQFQVANYAGSKGPARTVVPPTPNVERKAVRARDPYKQVPNMGTLRNPRNR